MGLRERDAKVVWHPFTQMKTAAPPIPIVKGEGLYLIDEEGNRYLDAVSSWWVNIHGHAHPHIARKVAEQAQTLEHVIFAGFTHEPAVQLAERLTKLLPGQQSRVFYSDNGSTAIEVGIKMALQYWFNKAMAKNRILALEDAYHGDTFGAMSVSGRSAFTAPFESYLFDVTFIPVPRPDNIDMLKGELKEMLKGGEYAAFVFEPLVQGAGGMKMYEAAMLDEVIALCRAHDVITIADEVMTGFGRTGKRFACDHLKHHPDIVCLSKGITGGAMALGATTCTEEIYNAFLSENKMKTLFHGHSYTANPIACSAALASMDLVEQDNFVEAIERISAKHLTFKAQIEKLPYVGEARCTGTILAIEFKVDQTYSYFSTIRDDLYHYFLEKRILCRPLGNIIYLMPPYCITNEELEFLYQNITKALEHFLGNK